MLILKMHMCVHMCVHVCLCVWACVCACACVHVCACVCVQVCECSHLFQWYTPYLLPLALFCPTLLPGFFSFYGILKNSIIASCTHPIPLIQSAIHFLIKYTDLRHLVFNKTYLPKGKKNEFMYLSLYSG